MVAASLRCIRWIGKERGGGCSILFGVGNTRRAAALIDENGSWNIAFRALTRCRDCASIRGMGVDEESEGVTDDA